MSNTKTIAKNTGWYGLETGIAAVVTIFTSIAIARVLGPSKMGYVVYVSWIASMTASLGGIGVPATTRKYMAEFLGMGDRATARLIYIRTLVLQAGMASLATVLVLIWVVTDAQPGYKLASILIVLSIWPSMVNSISAQANVAAEELWANLPASVMSTFTFFAVIAATVVFKWGILGVGASMLSMRLVDFLVRFFPTLKRIRSWESHTQSPEGLDKRMTTFALQSVATMILSLIVWERSEFFLLKYLCADVRQIAFYSVAFSLADRLMVGSQVFGSATGATIFAQYGRDRSRLPAITAATFRYIALISMPLHFIAAALAAPALLLLYGNQYVGAAAVVSLAPLLCMPKAFLGPVESLLQSTEMQNWIIISTVAAGVIDIGVAAYLIPKYGAVGACIGSGAAQIVAVGIMWALGIYLFNVKLPWLQLAKITVISGLAALAAHFISSALGPLWGILCGGSAALAILIALCYMLRVLEPEDQARFRVLSKMLPKRMTRPAERLVSWMTRPTLSAVAPPGA
ncbi:MAG TPA: oligosaccharide flippase family protein [Terracidiphilus sp.]|jgi:O-antigen/teichoic acid export membrane protein